MESLLYVAHGNSEAQVKIVVQDEEETEEALERFEEIRSEVSRSVLRWPHRRIHLILQQSVAPGLTGCIERGLLFEVGASYIKG